MPVAEKVDAVLSTPASFGPIVYPRELRPGPIAGASLRSENRVASLPST